MKAIRQGTIDTLVSELAAVEAMIKHLKQEKQQLEGEAAEPSKFWSHDAVAANFLEAVTELALTSLDFAEALRQLLPEFVIQPVQALDSGLVRAARPSDATTG